MADGGALTEYDEVLAPASVSRLSGQAIELRPGLWEVAMGDAVPAFVMSNGPGAMTNYNLAKVRGGPTTTLRRSVGPHSTALSSHADRYKHRPASCRKSTTLPTSLMSRSLVVAQPRSSPASRCSLWSSTALAKVAGSTKQLTPQTACAHAVVRELV